MPGRGTCGIGLVAAAGAFLAVPGTGSGTASVERDSLTFARATTSLHEAIDRWRSRGTAAPPRPPLDVLRAAHQQQRLVIRLSFDPSRAEDVVARLQGRVGRDARATMRARLALGGMTVVPELQRRSFRTGQPLPPDLLLRYYRRAERRFGVGWHVLAAVNFVESAFGRMRSPSSAGALGPMQFMPPTWAAYGLGGDVHTPHDAIMAAANYLRASGAPGDYWGALYAYNHSGSYVEAVLRYASQMKRDVRSFYAYYSWEVFVRTASGVRQLTGLRLGRSVIRTDRACSCLRRAPSAQRDSRSQPLEGPTQASPEPVGVEDAAAVRTSPLAARQTGGTSRNLPFPDRRDAWGLRSRAQSPGPRAEQERSAWQARAPPEAR